MKILLLLTSLFLICGCSTIMTKSSQPISFSSEPEGATVFINQTERCITPDTIEVKKARGKQMVTYTLNGYYDVDFALNKSVSEMTLGNFVFGGVIGAGVDAWTGKISKYDDSVHVVMTPLSQPKPEPAVDQGKR